MLLLEYGLFKDIYHTYSLSGRMYFGPRQRVCCAVRLCVNGFMFTSGGMIQDTGIWVECKWNGLQNRSAVQALNIDDTGRPF